VPKISKKSCVRRLQFLTDDRGGLRMLLQVHVNRILLGEIKGENTINVG
jgi:hypothetical protein